MPKCGTGTSWPSTGLCAGAIRLRARDHVADELVAEEIEVHPVGGAAALRAAEQLAIEGARRGEVAHRDRQVEGREFGHQPSSRAFIEISAFSTLLSGQPVLAFSAACSNFARSAPGARTATSRCERVIVNPVSSFSKVIVACRLDALGLDAGLAELRRQRHREAARVRGAEQLLGVRARRALEARAERIRRVRRGPCSRSSAFPCRP